MLTTRFSVVLSAQLLLYLDKILESVLGWKMVVQSYVCNL